MMFANILVPFDKSKHALRALEVAKGFAAEDPAVRLHIFSAIYVCHETNGSGRRCRVRS